MRFYKDEWDEFENNCGFTEEEKQIIKLLREEKNLSYIADTLCYGYRTLDRRCRRIRNKIEHYLAKKR